MTCTVLQRMLRHAIDFSGRMQWTFWVSMRMVSLYLGKGLCNVKWRNANERRNAAYDRENSGEGCVLTEYIFFPAMRVYLQV
mmetsp:Transcript_28435/g.56875  ORF Transcript_28435/g.56875 Transcript_28435/m.56875 type:complete len:82 (+) Transcript_28435:38-283(+)